MKEHPDYPWDHHSDQPHIMRNKELKRSIYKRSWLQLLKANLLLLSLPTILPLYLLQRRSSPSKKPGQCLGLSVHVETQAKGKTPVPLNDVIGMIEELGVKHLLMRIPLADIDNLDTYLTHLEALRRDGREVIINLLQTRTLLDAPDAQRQAIEKVIRAIKGKVAAVQVGNAYNRKKWGFDHFGHYQLFFQEVRRATESIAPELRLIGGSTIDFEPMHLLESLFHLRSNVYDGYATQLYVDRRGAPENTQLGFNFLGKINFISLLHKLSWRSKGDLWITEFNWPLENVAPFAPCVNNLVSEQDQANFLARSYLIAMASGRVRTCYWHQLVAPGYGLVDNRGNTIRKHPSYHALATLIQLFSQASNIHLQEENSIYKVTCTTFYNGTPCSLVALWSNDLTQCDTNESADLWIDQSGNPIEGHGPKVGNSVIYGISS